MKTKQTAVKQCKQCGKQLEKKRYGSRLEDLGVFKRRQYCSLHCANKRDRPKHWETYHWRARKHRKKYCESCGSTEKLHAHHADGQPANNDPSNIQTLCVYCHNFLHATADRLGWRQPGRMPQIGGTLSQTLEESQTESPVGSTALKD